MKNSDYHLMRRRNDMDRNHREFVGQPIHTNKCMDGTTNRRNKCSSTNTTTRTSKCINAKPTFNTKTKRGITRS
ncbi:hypothetical protein Bca101_089710 [Brassica carinata]